QINKMPYAQVPAGGTLTWPSDSTIVQFNSNEIDGNDINFVYLTQALIPQLFLSDAANRLTYNPNYLASDPKVGESGGHQTVTYEINPKARGADGTQISANDFVAQWKALGGTNGAFKVVATTGYDDITSVVP